MNLHWPKTEERPNLSPWYEVLWRLPPFALFLLGRLCMAASIWWAYRSFGEAQNFWRNS